MSKLRVNRMDLTSEFEREMASPTKITRVDTYIHLTLKYIYFAPGTCLSTLHIFIHLIFIAII